MRACGDAGLLFSRVSVRDRDKVDVRVGDGVRVSTFYFLSH